MMRRVWFLVLFALCLGTGTPASAHSFIEKAQPVPGSVVAKAPQRVTIRFREPAVPRFSRVSVLDSRGHQVSEPARFSSDHRQAIVVLRRLAPGKYTVKWRILSELDGHTTASTYTFTIAKPKSGGWRLMPAHAMGVSFAGVAFLSEAEDMHVDWAWAYLLIKWVVLVASIALVGAALFTVFVLDPFVAAASSEGIPHAERSFATVRSMSVTAALVLLAAIAVGTISQAAMLLEVGVREVFSSGELIPFLTQTKPGWSALVQGTLALILLLPQSPTGRILQVAALGLLALAGAAAALLGGGMQALSQTHLVVGVFWSLAYGLTVATLAVALPRIPGIHLPSLSWAPALVGLMLLTGGVLTSHSLPLGVPAAAIHWMHLAAISMWIGGLGALVAVLRSEEGPVRARIASVLVPRFSRFAGIGLGLTAVTGGALAIFQVSEVSAVVSSLYGRLLLLKLTFIAPLVTLGALIRVFLIPRIKNGEQVHAAGMAFRFATGEVGLVIVVIAISAMLSNTPPARMSNVPAPKQVEQTTRIGTNLEQELPNHPAVLKIR